MTDWNSAPKMVGEIAVQSNWPASSSARRISASKSGMRTVWDKP